MNNTVLKFAPVNRTELVASLAAQFAERAAKSDQEGQFVQQNYNDLRFHQLFSVGVPAELGGGGADYPELCQIVRTLGKHCGSTGLAYAMHTHPLALNVFKYRRDDEKAKNTLTKIAANELIIAGTGANDWLDSKGEAQKVPGGYLVSARKSFVSGGPGAQVLVTSAPFNGENGAEVLHFSIPFSSHGISIENNWRTIGMRGTGSNDVILKKVFVADEAIVARRPAGVWHMIWDVILPIAMPLIVSCYVGIAEAAAESALKSAQNKPHLAALLGELHNELTTAQMAVDDMVRISDNYGFKPDQHNTDAILTRKSIAARAVKASVEKAAEIVGGAGFFQDHPVERCIRDVRAMHFHPLPEKRQQQFSGRIALGLDPVA